MSYFSLNGGISEKDLQEIMNSEGKTREQALEMLGLTKEEFKKESEELATNTKENVETSKKHIPHQPKRTGGKKSLSFNEKPDMTNYQPKESAGSDVYEREYAGQAKSGRPMAGGETPPPILGMPTARSGLKPAIKKGDTAQKPAAADNSAPAQPPIVTPFLSEIPYEQSVTPTMGGLKPIDQISADNVLFLGDTGVTKNKVINRFAIIGDQGMSDTFVIPAQGLTHEGVVAAYSKRKGQRFDNIGFRAGSKFLDGKGIKTIQELKNALSQEELSMYAPSGDILFVKIEHIPTGEECGNEKDAMDICSVFETRDPKHSQCVLKVKEVRDMLSGFHGAVEKNHAGLPSVMHDAWHALVSNREIRLCNELEEVRKILRERALVLSLIDKSAFREHEKRKREFDALQKSRSMTERGTCVGDENPCIDDMDPTERSKHLLDLSQKIQAELNQLYNDASAKRSKLLMEESKNAVMVRNKVSSIVDELSQKWMRMLVLEEQKTIERYVSNVRNRIMADAKKDGPLKYLSNIPYFEFFADSLKVYTKSTSDGTPDLALLKLLLDRVMAGSGLTPEQEEDLRISKHAIDYWKYMQQPTNESKFMSFWRELFGRTQDQMDVLALQKWSENPHNRVLRFDLSKPAPASVAQQIKEMEYAAKMSKEMQDTATPYTQYYGGVGISQFNGQVGQVGQVGPMTQMGHPVIRQQATQGPGRHQIKQQLGFKNGPSDDSGSDYGSDYESSSEDSDDGNADAPITIYDKTASVSECNQHEWVKKSGVFNQKNTPADILNKLDTLPQRLTQKDLNDWLHCIHINPRYDILINYINSQITKDPTYAIDFINYVLDHMPFYMDFGKILCDGKHEITFTHPIADPLKKYYEGEYSNQFVAMVTNNRMQEMEAQWLRSKVIAFYHGKNAIAWVNDFKLKPIKELFSDAKGLDLLSLCSSDENMRNNKLRQAALYLQMFAPLLDEAKTLQSKIGFSPLDFGQLSNDLSKWYDYIVFEVLDRPCESWWAPLLKDIEPLLNDSTITDNSLLATKLEKWGERLRAFVPNLENKIVKDLQPAYQVFRDLDISIQEYMLNSYNGPEYDITSERKGSGTHGYYMITNDGNIKYQVYIPVTKFMMKNIILSNFLFENIKDSLFNTPTKYNTHSMYDDAVMNPYIMKLLKNRNIEKLINSIASVYPDSTHIITLYKNEEQLERDKLLAYSGKNAQVVGEYDQLVPGFVKDEKEFLLSLIGPNPSYYKAQKSGLPDEYIKSLKDMNLENIRIQELLDRPIFGNDKDPKINRWKSIMEKRINDNNENINDIQRSIGTKRWTDGRIKDILNWIKETTGQNYLGKNDTFVVHSPFENINDFEVFVENGKYRVSDISVSSLDAIQDLRNNIISLVDSKTREYNETTDKSVKSQIKTSFDKDIETLLGTTHHNIKEDSKKGWVDWIKSFNIWNNEIDDEDVHIV